MAHFIVCEKIIDTLIVAHLFFKEVYRLQSLSSYILSNWNTQFLGYF